MYSRQKGLLPTFTFFVGFFLIAYVFLNMLYLLTLVWARGVPQQSLVATIFEALLAIMTYALVFSPFFVGGLFIAGMFPEIKLTKYGIQYRYLQFFSSSIRWEEIEDVIPVIRPQECLALVVARKGISLFNGLWFNAMYGIMNRHERPLLLLSKGLEGRDNLVHEIRERRWHSTNQPSIART